jgi:hypothetical protein
LVLLMPGVVLLGLSAASSKLRVLATDLQLVLLMSGVVQLRVELAVLLLLSPKRPVPILLPNARAAGPELLLLRVEGVARWPRRPMLLPEGLVLLVLRPCSLLAVRAMVLLAFAGGGGGVWLSVALLPLLTTKNTGPLLCAAELDFHLLVLVVVLLLMLGMGPACSAAVAGLMLKTGVAAG